MRQKKLSKLFSRQRTRKVVRNRSFFTRIRKTIFFVLATLVAGFLFGFGLEKLKSKGHFLNPLVLSFNQGGNIDQARVADALKKANISFSAIDILPDSIKITTKDKEEIILSPFKNLQEQVSSLQFILRRLTMESKGIARLDLRFDKPVVLFR